MGEDVDRVRAIVQSGYGSVETLRVAEVEDPVVTPDEVLLRVRVASVHAGDVLVMQGRPLLFRAGTGLRRPRNPIPGYDVAGTIVEVGSKVSEFKPGDQVFGNGRSTLAELATAKPSQLVMKPEGISFTDAGVLTVSGLTALRAVQQVGRVAPGQRVLINGAAGGIGTFAVQIAKAAGAEVTGVCSGGKAALVRSIGADHVIDYTVDDFTAGSITYDFILDNVGNRSLSQCRRVLATGGTLIPNSGTAGGSLVGPLFRMGHALAVSPFTAQNLRVFVSIPNPQDLAALRDLVESGVVTPVIGSTYSLDDAPKAFAHIASGHAVGKAAIEVAD